MENLCKIGYFSKYMEYPMVCSNLQIAKLLQEMSKHGNLEKAAMAASMSRETARKYVHQDRGSFGMKGPRSWKTRSDIFSGDWANIAEILSEKPGLEAKTLFEEIVIPLNPQKYHLGHLRTFQRRVKSWRAKEGPDKEVFFSQVHRPGEAMQTDFTSCNKLGIVIGGLEFKHLLCQVTLPYSNWRWATICKSESMMALRRGVQAAVFELGHVPKYHQTDNSTAATHRVSAEERKFNNEYMELMNHLNLTPRTIQIGKKNQNGDIESAHNVLKRKLEQHLILRGSRNFSSEDEYRKWIQGIILKLNKLIGPRIQEEIKHMTPITVHPIPEYSEVNVDVSGWSTIIIKGNTYSVPSRLIKEKVRVRVYDDLIKVYHGNEIQLVANRLLGNKKHKINYRHVIWSLVRKPAAFERYRYREELFPSLPFRKSYDALHLKKSSRAADLEYLRILHLAASTMESDVAVCLSLLLEDGQLPTLEAVKDLVNVRSNSVPRLKELEINLKEYDDLLSREKETSQ